jgi:hypothetical protein
MKPSDHPDFFRLPPPPGRSRESRIVLDEKGQFSNAGIPVDHAGMAVAFASWIRRHPDDGRFILTNGYDWTYFTVMDVPHFVRHVDNASGSPLLRLLDGTEEALRPDGVSVSTDGILYARVKGGDMDARFLPTAQAEMVDVIAESADGSPCVELAGRQFAIARR